MGGTKNFVKSIKSFQAEHFRLPSFLQQHQNNGGLSLLYLVSYKHQQFLALKSLLDFILFFLLFLTYAAMHKFCARSYNSVYLGENLNFRLPRPTLSGLHDLSPACLPVCLPLCLPTCQPDCPTCLFVCLSVDQPFRLPSRLPIQGDPQTEPLQIIVVDLFGKEFH